MRDLTLTYPVTTQLIANALARVVADKFDRYGIFPDGHELVSTVSAKSYDGFIAHTNGGFRVTVPCTLRDVESEGLTDFEESVLREYIDNARIDAADEFLRARPELQELREDSPLQSDDWIYAHIEALERDWNERYHNPNMPEFEGIEAAPRYCAEAEALREDFWTYCDEWMSEGSTFFYEIRVLFFEADHRNNNTGADEMYVMSGINTDFEYGREYGLETALERDIKLARLTPARIDKIVDALADAL